MPRPSADIAPASQVGVWLIGAGGNVATTVALALDQLAIGAIEPIGLATETEPMRSLPLVGIDRLVLGGHELARRPIETARDLAERDRLFPASLVERSGRALGALEARIKPGVTGSATGQDARPVLGRVRDDLREFAQLNELERVVVVNLASTEAAMPGPLPQTRAELDARLGAGDVPPSVVYAAAAIDLG